MIAVIGSRIAMHKGDAGIVEVQAFTDSTLTTPLDITGYTCTFTVADDYATAFSAAVIKKDSGGLGGVVITDAAQGKYQIQFSKSWTNALTSKPYVYSTKVVSPAGNPYTMGAGDFDLMENVPHE